MPQPSDLPYQTGGSIYALMDASPLVISPTLALAIGVNEALVVQQVYYWCKVNWQKGSQIHHHDGRWWTYNTYVQWQETFVFWSVDTIQRLFLKLENQGLLLSRTPHLHLHDRCKWYTLNFAMVEQKVAGAQAILMERRDTSLQLSAPTDRTVQAVAGQPRLHSRRGGRPRKDGSPPRNRRPQEPTQDLPLDSLVEAENPITPSTLNGATPPLGGTTASVAPVAADADQAPATPVPGAADALLAPPASSLFDPFEETPTGAADESEVPTNEPPQPADTRHPTPDTRSLSHPPLATPEPIEIPIPQNRVMGFSDPESTPEIQKFKIPIRESAALGFSELKNPSPQDRAMGFSRSDDSEKSHDSESSHASRDSESSMTRFCGVNIRYIHTEESITERTTTTTGAGAEKAGPDPAPTETTETPETAEKAVVVDTLCLFGMSRDVALDLTERTPLPVLQRQIDYWPYRPESRPETEGGIGRNPPGFLRRCIQHDYTPPPAWHDAEADRKRARQVQQRRAQEEAARAERERLLDRVAAHWESLDDATREQILTLAAERLKAGSDWWKAQERKGGPAWVAAVIAERQEIVAERLGIVLPK